MPVPLMKTPRIPTLACIGYVSEVGQMKETEDKGDGKPNYCMIPITLTPFEGGKKKVVNFLFRPEWFVPDFDPNKDIKEQWGDQANGPLFVYRRSFGTNSTIGVLTGIAGGSQQAGDALYDAIQVATGNGTHPEDVVDILRDNIIGDGEEDGKILGYIVSQQSRRVKNDNDQWETVYTDQTEVSGFWEVTEKAKAEMEKRARRQKDGLFRVTWETEE